MKTIRIIDDYENAPMGDKATAEQWKSELESLLGEEGFKIELLTDKEIGEEIRALEARRLANRRGESINLGDSCIDETDILVVDFDLLYLQAERNVSGEDIAYLARCFSKCGLIVGLNRFRRNGDFNLNLFSPLDSFSDYDVLGKQLTDPGLWFPDPKKWNDFRPWYWPALTVETEHFSQRIQQVLDAMDTPILDRLGFPQEIKDTLPRVLASFLEGNGDDYRSVTFGDFVKYSPNSLRGKEDGLPLELAARVAAARVQAWLERAVLPRLDILVDAPHLVEIYASLLPNTEDIISWNGSAHLTYPKIDTDKVSGEAWEEESWLSRKAWWKESVARNRDIPEVTNPWGTPRPDFVFQEDSSRFEQRRILRRFVVETTSPHTKRYVGNIAGISYVPAIRLAM